VVVEICEDDTKMLSHGRCVGCEFSVVYRYDIVSVALEWDASALEVHHNCSGY
jgi:hypothetical protein